MCIVLFFIIFVYINMCIVFLYFNKYKFDILLCIIIVFYINLNFIYYIVDLNWRCWYFILCLVCLNINEKVFEFKIYVFLIMLKCSLYIL